MSIQGTVRNGRVILDEGVILPEGLRVEIEPVPKADSGRASDESQNGAGSPVKPAVEEAQSPSWRRRIAPFVGSVEGESDHAANHGHYAHGQPRSRS
jgi:hypothetical protein